MKFQNTERLIEIKFKILCYNVTQKNKSENRILDNILVEIYKKRFNYDKITSHHNFS